LTHDLYEFNASLLPKINYSENETQPAFTIKPHSILNDYGLRDYPLEVTSDPVFEKIFFRSSGADLPFDLFGAAFWLLSRYEEYLPHRPDQLKRFHYKSSLAYQYDFIRLPLVNLWLDAFKKLLLLRFESLEFSQKNYRFVSTIDIDNAYKFKYKGFVRTFAGFFSDRNLKQMKQRFNIVFLRKKDPFDCYSFLVETHKQQGIETIYFFLLGDYGVNDKNHSSSNIEFQTLIKHLADYSQVGIHPSFGSRANLHQLRVETNRLSGITHKVISKSRQHFSILKFPETYRELLQAGILEDYSMGYTNFNGFRASYCYPFTWYSLETESETPLRLNPFVITENTLKQDAEQTHVSFVDAAKPLIQHIKKYNGLLISVFHNDTFTEEMKKNYLLFIELATH